jgi:hypothetical protein
MFIFASTGLTLRNGAASVHARCPGRLHADRLVGNAPAKLLDGGGGHDP